jgi:hypothetical protein
MSNPRFSSLPTAGVLAGLLGVAALSGCSTGTPMEPSGTRTSADELAAASARPDAGLDARDFFGNQGVVDLSLDRLSVATGAFRARIVPEGQEPGPWVEVTFTVERQVMGLSTPAFGGPTYVRERVRRTEGTNPFTHEDLWRQDRSGLYLYQADAEAAALPRLRIASMARTIAGPSATPEQALAYARAAEDVAAKRAALLLGPPGGALSSEITFLRYPLHRGASWEGRVGFNVWTVEEVEWLALPTGRMRAARMRIELPGQFGPNDRALTWWDAPGEVKREFHLFGTATDEQGNEIGEFETLESFELTAYGPAPPI